MLLMACSPYTSHKNANSTQSEDITNAMRSTPMPKGYWKILLLNVVIERYSYAMYEYNDEGKLQIYQP